MAKRASSPSAGTPTGKKKAKVTSAVVTKKAPVVTPSGKKSGKVEAKVSSSSNSNRSAATPSIIKASPSNASASKASASKPSTSNVSSSKPSTSKAITSKAITSKAITSKARTSKPQKPFTAAQLKQKQKEDEEKEAELKKKVFDEELGEYTVERILGKRVSDETGIDEYKVKWLGYDEDRCTWETVHNLANSMKQVLLWERSQAGKKWRLVPYPNPIDNVKRNIEIRTEYLRLTVGGYSIKEKYGSANKHTWFLMKRGEDEDDQVLCLKDDDPHYQKLDLKSFAISKSAGAWENEFPEETAPEKKTPKKKTPKEKTPKEKTSKKATGEK